MWNTSIWPMDKTLSGSIPPGQGGPGSNSNEGVLQAWLYFGFRSIILVVSCFLARLRGSPILVGRAADAQFKNRNISAANWSQAEIGGKLNQKSRVCRLGIGKKKRRSSSSTQRDEGRSPSKHMRELQQKRRKIISMSVSASLSLSLALSLSLSLSNYLSPHNGFFLSV